MMMKMMTMDYMDNYYHQPARRLVLLVLLLLQCSQLLIVAKEMKSLFSPITISSSMMGNSTENFLTNQYYSTLSFHDYWDDSRSKTLKKYDIDSNTNLINKSQQSSPIPFSITKSHATELLRSFLDYSFHFPYDHSLEEKELTCSKSSFRNITQRFLESVITNCVNPAYFPRFVSRQQITWKPRKDDTAEKKPQNETNSSDKNSTSDSPTTNKVIPENTTNEDNSSSSSSKRGDKIHTYLIFAIILPDHPYSLELLQILGVVSPLFPKITYIVGEIHEFKDVTNKYLIHSFPKLLLFKNGIFMNDYTLEVSGKMMDNSSPQSLSAYNFQSTLSLMNYLMIWTKSFPVSYPMFFNRQNKMQSLITKHYRKIKSYKFYNITGILSSYYLKEEEDSPEEVAAAAAAAVTVPINNATDPRTDDNDTDPTVRTNSTGENGNNAHNSAKTTNQSDAGGGDSKDEDEQPATTSFNYWNQPQLQQLHNIIITLLIKTFAWLEHVPFPFPNTEPFIGTIATNEYHFQLFDFVCFVFSIIYIFLRLLMKAHKYYRWWIEGPEPEQPRR